MRAAITASSSGLKGQTLRKSGTLNSLHKHQKLTLMPYAAGSNLLSMKSMSTLSHSYQVDLSKQSCDCVDWPRAQLCKHVTAAAHFFGDLSLLKVEHTLPTAQPIREGSANMGEGNISSTLEDLLSVSRAFLTLEARTPSSPDTSQSLQTVVAHVTALYHKAHTSENLLPEKDSIPPNKGMWRETAERMGATQQKQKRPHHTSSPDQMATAHIRELNWKKCHVKNTDPYSGGLRSGKHAAPDAQAVAQNMAACTRAAAAPAPPVPFATCP